MVKVWQIMFIRIIIVGAEKKEKKKVVREDEFCGFDCFKNG
jgi:hypothetical protein